MGMIDEIKQRFLTLETAIENDFMPKIAKELSSRLEDKIIEQLDRGERGDGKTLPVYSPVSVGVFGKSPGPITLDNTGAFRQGIHVDVQQDGVEFYGTDPKTDMLMFHYGEEILDLQPKSIGEFNDDDVKEELVDFVKEYLTT